MKKLILVAAISCIAFTGYSQTDNTDKSLAKVEQIVTKEGSIYAFVSSEPATPYEVLGKVNMPEVVWNGKAGEMIKIASQRTLKQFKNADAVILKGKNLNEAVAIKFK